MRSLRIVLALLLALMPVVAQEASEQGVDLQLIQELRIQAEENVSLEPGLRTRLLELYDQAISDLQTAQQAESRIAGSSLPKRGHRVRNSQAQHPGPQQFGFTRSC